MGEYRWNNGAASSTRDAPTFDQLAAMCRRIDRRPGRMVWSYRGTMGSFLAAMEAGGVERLKVGPMEVVPLGMLDVVQWHEWVLIGTARDIADFLSHPEGLVRSVLRQKELAPTSRLTCRRP